ncbi:MAG: Hsp70 family protein [Erysipelotrichaceae bacterium]|nr:Hsp70 family protein [Erysipelotrichaceae bacterium]
MVIVGIDLGTTNSVCAIRDEDKTIKYIQFDNQTILPSCLYDDGKSKYIGKKAKQKGLMKPEYYIASAKRHMEDGEYRYHVGNKAYSAEDVASEILSEICNQIRLQTGEQGDIDAVITIPANFRDYAVKATKRAGERAGFHNVKTLKEPISSVIAYGIDKNKSNGYYFVVDLGGGTLDISVVEVQGNNFETVYTGGDPKLGGDDFTNIIKEMIEDELIGNEKYGHINLDKDSIEGDMVLSSIFENDNALFLRCKYRILKAAEEAKICLSSETFATIDIPNIFTINGQKISFIMEISRKDFEKKAKRLFDRYDRSIRDALDFISKNENITAKDIKKVIFAGGSMNLPKAKSIIKDYFKQEPLDRDLDKVVAQGAAVYANSEYNKDPHQTGVSEIKVSHVLYYNLGVDIFTGELTPIIKSGTKYPPEITATKPYTTTKDNQTSIFFRVFEGNVLSNADDPENKKLFEFTISGLRQQKKGEPNVDITFRLDEEGILHIHAEDREGIALPFDDDVEWYKNRKE